MTKEESGKCSYPDCGTLELISDKTLYRTDFLGKPFCILHWPVVELKRDSFRAAWQQFLSNHKNEKGEYRDLNCSGFIFPEAVDFTKATFSERANFDNATFCGDASFASATFSGEARFEGAKFMGNALFSPGWLSDDAETTFKGNALFTGATFGGDANFFDTTFRGKARFEDATFSRSVRFDGSTFGELATFDKATFSGRVWFDGRTFSKLAWFVNATFSGRVSFGNATFIGEARFGNAKFHDDVSFNQARWQGGADFYRARLKEASLDFIGGKYEDENKQEQDTWLFEGDREIRFDHINFREAKRVRFDQVDLSRASFLGSRIEDIDFVDVWWEKEGKGHEIYNEKKWLEERKKDKTRKEDKSREIENLYHQLVINYDRRREYEIGGEFYVRENEVRKIRKGRPWNALEYIYQWTSHYGQKCARPLVWILPIFLMVTWCFIKENWTLSGLFDFPLTVIGPIWYAIRDNLLYLFNAIKSDDIGIGKNSQLLAAFERLLIYYLLSMFLLALRRRFRR